MNTKDKTSPEVNKPVKTIAGIAELVAQQAKEILAIKSMAERSQEILEFHLSKRVTEGREQYVTMKMFDDKTDKIFFALDAIGRGSAQSACQSQSVQNTLLDLITTVASLRDQQNAMSQQLTSLINMGNHQPMHRPFSPTDMPAQTTGWAGMRPGSIRQTSFGPRDSFPLPRGFTQVPPNDHFVTGMSHVEAPAEPENFMKGDGGRKMLVSQLVDFLEQCRGEKIGWMPDFDLQMTPGDGGLKVKFAYMKPRPGDISTKSLAKTIKEEVLYGSGVVFLEDYATKNVQPLTDLQRFFDWVKKSADDYNSTVDKQPSKEHYKLNDLINDLKALPPRQIGFDFLFTFIPNMDGKTAAINYLGPVPLVTDTKQLSAKFSFPGLHGNPELFVGTVGGDNGSSIVRLESVDQFLNWMAISERDWVIRDRVQQFHPVGRLYPNVFTRNEESEKQSADSDLRSFNKPYEPKFFNQFSGPNEKEETTTTTGKTFTLSDFMQAVIRLKQQEENVGIGGTTVSEFVITGEVTPFGPGVIVNPVTPGSGSLSLAQAWGICNDWINQDPKSRIYLANNAPIWVAIASGQRATVKSFNDLMRHIFDTRRIFP